MGSGGTSAAQQGQPVSAYERLRLLEAAERVAQLGCWEWLPSRDVQFWSDNLYRLFGLEVSQIVPTREFVLERTLRAGRLPELTGWSTPASCSTPAVHPTALGC